MWIFILGICKQPNVKKWSINPNNCNNTSLMCTKYFVPRHVWCITWEQFCIWLCRCYTSTSQTRYIPAVVNNSTLISATQVIFHSPVAASGGLITGDPRALARTVAAEVLMQALPCRWPGHLAPSRSATCRWLPPGGQARALQRPGTCCSFSWPPLPSTWSRIRNPGWRGGKMFPIFKS